MNDHTTHPTPHHTDLTPAYRPPTIKDCGSLADLTLSGTAPLSDSFGGAAGGGS